MNITYKWMVYTNTLNKISWEMRDKIYVLWRRPNHNVINSINGMLLTIILFVF